jgi:hypothetical protein
MNQVRISTMGTRGTGPNESRKNPAEPSHHEPRSQGLPPSDNQRGEPKPADPQRRDANSLFLTRQTSNSSSGRAEKPATGSVASNRFRRSGAAFDRRVDAEVRLSPGAHVCAECTAGGGHDPLGQAQQEVRPDVSVLDDIKFYFFHHHHYPEVPANRDPYEATWVIPPSGELFDAEKGHAAYRHHLRIVKLADELGFDGICINEHHNTLYSMTPATSLMGAAIATATTRAKIMVAGVPVNLAYPNRVAEEYGMLDVMSGGRMEYAFPLGTGMEYWSNEGTVNPTTARARFRESLDIILKAWTEDGPMRYEGDFYSYRYLNPLPKPYQKPYPKLFVVGSGSMETVELALVL